MVVGTETPRGSTVTRAGIVEAVQVAAENGTGWDDAIKQASDETGVPATRIAEIVDLAENGSVTDEWLAETES
jgi:hypothetical protein